MARPAPPALPAPHRRCRPAWACSKISTSGRSARSLRPHAVHARARPPAPAGGAGRLRGCQHVGQHGAAADRVQHLGQVASACARPCRRPERRSAEAVSVIGRFSIDGALRVALPADLARPDSAATIMPGSAKRADLPSFRRPIASCRRRPARAPQCYGIRSTCPQPGPPGSRPALTEPSRFETVPLRFDLRSRRASAQQRLNLERGRARPWLRIPISPPAPGGSSRSTWRPGRRWPSEHWAIWRIWPSTARKRAHRRTQAAEPDPSQAMRALAKTTGRNGHHAAQPERHSKGRRRPQGSRHRARGQGQVGDGRASPPSKNGWRPCTRPRSRPKRPVENQGPDKAPAQGGRTPASRPRDQRYRKKAGTCASSAGTVVQRRGPACAARNRQHLAEGGDNVRRARRSRAPARLLSPFNSPPVPRCRVCGRAGASCASGTGRSAALEPRIVPPRSDGGPYRLLAGPFATKADADRVCTEMGVGRNGCYVTTYIGAPL